MIDVLAYLTEREQEFERHLRVARMLEQRVDEEITEAEFRIEVRHVNTMKSGLLIHLYNIVESVTTKTLAEVGRVAALENPKLWTSEVMKEWIRAKIWDGKNEVNDNVIGRLFDVSSSLVANNNMAPFIVKGEPGSLDDQSVTKIAKRLGCKLVIVSKVKRGALEKKYRNETTAMKFLADRRNAIAHGACTFEDGANFLTLEEIEDLAERVLPYLRAVSESYQSFLNEKHFLAPKEVAL